VPGRLRISSSTSCTVIAASLLASQQLYLCRERCMSVAQGYLGS
jgi:hypothetical protein